MRYLFAVLLLAGCASPPVKVLNADEQAKRDEYVRQTCDFMVGQPRDSMDYLSCMEMAKTDMK